MHQHGDEGRDRADTAAIDGAADAADVDQGWLEVPGYGTVVLAPSLEDAARIYGSPVMTVDGWIAVGGAGRQLRSWRTPAGRTVWTEGNFMTEVPCSPEEASPAVRP